MRLDEFNKPIEKMSKEELEQAMLACISSMNETLDLIDIREQDENARSRKGNH